MQIFVTAQNGKMVTLEVEGHMTVADIKALVREQEGLEVSRLITPMTVEIKVNMLDKRTLASYNVQKEHQMQLVSKGTAQADVLFHARHPNNQGARYLWKYSYLSLKPGVWDLDSGSLAGLITLGGACAPPYNDSLSRCKFMNKSVAGTEVAWHRPYEYQ